MTLLTNLYALAISFLVVAFVGFGISAFYPAPEFPQDPQETEFGGPPSTEEEKVDAAEQREEVYAFQEQFSEYNKVVSSIAIGAAILLLVISILRLYRLPVIGDGVTLGAVFTLFYGLIRAFMTEDEVFRFIAVAVGLVLVLALVYWKFMRSSRGRASRPETET